MKKLLGAYLLGILSFILSIVGVFALLFSVPGLILAILSLKMPEKKVTIPLGYQGRVGKKNFTAMPFMTTRYLSFIAIGLNIFSIAVSLFATFTIFSLFVAGMR